MLEALVRPRIRRALLEHILTHPTERFYLRGLAKELGLSISPLRRELKRLEQAGMLKTDQEANILFYVVDTASAAFGQLRRAGQPSEALPSAYAAEGSRLKAQGSEQPSVTSDSVHARVAFSLQPSALSQTWRSPLRTPALIGATAVGMALVLIMVGLFYLTMTANRRLAAVTVVVPPASTSAPASGAMRGTRWQVGPGGFGGFTSGVSNDSY